MDSIKVRLDRILAIVGLGKRSSIKEMIKDELILVNSKIVKSNSYIKNEDIVTFTTNDYIIAFKVLLERKDNRIVVSIDPISKERVKEYTC